MPPVILLILQGISAAIALAPQVTDIYQAAKQLFTALFTAKVITKDQQDVLHSWVDSQQALVAQGVVPPAWQVEPDPD